MKAHLQVERKTGMQPYRLALIGFGNVGQGLAQILRDRQGILADQFGIEVIITAVCDSNKGTAFHPEGLSPKDLLASIQNGGDLDKVAADHPGWDAIETIENSGADVIVEMSYTNLQSGEPATSHIQKALELGKHVITTNKGPVALHYERLARIAAEHKVDLGVEGTVMSGTPALHLGSQYLKAAGIQMIEGIFNGTTNYILTEMAQGGSYAESLARAQELGFAEADPTGDVEGYDAAGKVVILANLLMDYPLQMRDVKRQGITHLTPGDIGDARSRGETWKLVGSVNRTGEGITASVAPVPLPNHHPLARVSGVTNAILYTTELLGEVTLIGAGAGRLETGYALLTDLLAIHRKRMGNGS